MVLHQEKLYTVEEFWAMAHLPENLGQRYDLIEGMLFELSPAGEEHGIIAGNLFALIWNYARAQAVGRVTAAETGYILSSGSDGKDTVLAPDVGFIRQERITETPSKKFVPFAPDLAVEVVSPGDSAASIHHKVMKYLQHGTSLVWVVYPDTQSVVVHTPAGSRTFDHHGTIDGGGVLPGFSLTVKDIFAV